jgi:hypothetical protein
MTLPDSRKLRHAHRRHDRHVVHTSQGVNMLVSKVLVITDPTTTPQCTDILAHLYHKLKTQSQIS